MKISKCYLLPKKCMHYPLCNRRNANCSKVDAQQCVHAVIYEDELKVVHGKDLYKLIDKNHPEYEHLYKLYDENYLDVLRKEKMEKDKIQRENFLKEEENRYQILKKRIEEQNEFYLNQANKTSGMNMR